MFVLASFCSYHSPSTFTEGRLPLTEQAIFTFAGHEDFYDSVPGFPYDSLGYK